MGLLIVLFGYVVVVAIILVWWHRLHKDQPRDGGV